MIFIKKNKKFLYSILSSLFLILSCDRNLTEFIGPSILENQEEINYIETVIDDFDDANIEGWWTSNELFQLQQIDSSLKISGSNVGPNYEVFGLNLGETINLNEKPIISINIKSENSLDIRLDLQDINSNNTDSEPVIVSVIGSNNFEQFNFDFNGKFGNVNSQAITSLIWFFNPGSNAFSGDVFFDDITFQIIDTTTVDTTEEVITQYSEILIDNFNDIDISDWFTSNSSFQLQQIDSSLKIIANNVGPNWDVFGLNFQPTDFSNLPIVKVELKIEDGVSVNIRMDLKDVNDNATNTTPVFHQITGNGEFNEYEFDFSNKFIQTWPENAIVDQNNISSFAIFLNGGGPSFSGVVYIDNLLRLTTNE